MASTPREVQSPREYDEILPIRDPVTNLNSHTTPQTIGDYKTKLEDLHRENFNLKLRIYFLEQGEPNSKQTLSTSVQRHRHPSQYEYYDQQDPSIIQQTGYETGQYRQSLSPTRHRPDLQANNENDELRSLRNRYDRDRQDNEKSRRLIGNPDEFRENAETLNIDPTTPTIIRKSPVDTDLATSMPVSKYHLPLEERERKLRDENNLLKKENASLAARLKETSNQLHDLDEQFQAEIRKNEEQQAKAERVMKRVKDDYDEHLAKMQEEQRQKLADYESYRHEQEQTNSNVNMKEHLREIDQRDRVIKELTDKLNGTNAYQQKPYTVLLPSSINPQTADENTRRLHEYAESIDQLRAECEELRRSEKYLRRQVDDLNRLFEPFNARLPPIPRASIVDDIQQVDDPQSAIVQTSLQLRNDAENVSGLTNRIAQMIRERDDNQNKLKEKDAQIRQYETREVEFENRIVQKFDLQIDGFQNEIKHLEKQIENRDRRLKELANENAQLRSQPRHDDNEIESHYTREKTNLQEQLNIADERINHLREDLDKGQQQYHTLRKDYEKVIRTVDPQNVAVLQNTVQKQEKQIENNQTQLHELENNFQQQRIYLERERDFEKGKVNQIQNELDVYKKRYHDLENQYEKLRPILDEQQTKYEKQIRNYQNDLAQIEQERDDLNEELQLLRDEKQIPSEEILENDPKFIELIQTNNDLKDQISRYEVRFHDSEDENKRHRNEFNTLQDDYQVIIQQYDDLKHNFAKAQNSLSSIEIEKNHIQTDIQTLNEKNAKLQHELEDMNVRIRIEIQQEYENEYRSAYDDLNQRKDAEIQNVQRDKETVEFELERVNDERTRFENQLHEIQNELQKANETIDNYERDIDRLREDLNRSKEKNDQIEHDVSRAYTDKLKDQNDHIQDLEKQLKIYEEQINQYEQRLPNLSQVHPSQRASNYYEPSKFGDNDRYERRQTAPNNQELIYQLENKLREQDDVIQSLRNSRAIIEGEPTDIQLELQIRIQRLEQDLETKERFIQKYSETVEAQEQQIERLLENLKQGDNSQLATIETLEEELGKRNRRIDDILNEQNSTIDQYKRQIGELELNIQDREHKLAHTNEKLEQAEQKIDSQQLEIDDLTRQNDRLTIVPEDKETYLNQIQDLEKELEMEKKIHDVTPSEQRDHYRNVIEDLKVRLRKRDDSIQRPKQYIHFDENLQRSLRTSDEELKDTRQDQHKMAGDYNRINLQTDQLASDVENRDQMITSLRQKLSEKEQEINKLHENILTKEEKLNELYSKMTQLDPDFKRTQSSTERTPSNVALKTELQRKDREINDLKQKLDEARRDRPDQSDLSTASGIPKEPRNRPRQNFDHLNRDELLFELDMALQHNQELNEQLKQKFPTITELHNQLVEVRHELSRQKYVNQVLWRKLNTLIDIHGSNTRNELAIELANYQDELAKLKLQQTRTNDARSVILNAHSRSSSEQNISSLRNGLSGMGNDLPSKNIKSTIALLERSNIEWQTKLARLTEQLGRSESQSRNYHRELIKYQKLLYDAGLTESPVRQRRRSADDSLIIGLNELPKISDDLTSIENLDDLKEIIRNQRKYNQQLQTRIRLNTPDLIQSPVIEKLNEQIQNLNLVIETYKNESYLLKNELKKLYKTIEYHRKISQQYEQLIKDQELSLDQLRKKLTKYDQLLKKSDIHLPLFDDKKENIIDRIDEYIIDLDLDIIQGNDKKKKTSLGKKDSAFSSATDTNEYQRQIREKDEQIRNLNNQLNDKDEQIQQMINELNNSKKPNGDVEHQNHNSYDRVRRDITDELQETQNELQEARLQIDALKTARPQHDQVDQQNQRLRAEIKQLQNEIERSKPLLEHYKTQIGILEQKSPPIHDSDTSEIVIRRSEFSQLLEEMRLLRRDLERSLQKQNELQAKLDENIRQSQSPREFTFSGRGVSYPDLRLIDSSGLIGAENLSLPSTIDKRRSRPVGSSSTEFDHLEYPQLSARDTEHTIPLKSYVVGEIRSHNDLRRLIEEIKFDLKAIGPELKDKVRSRISSSTTDAASRSLEERLISLDERLTHALDLIETYWKADLPERTKDNEHLFIDQRLLEENKKLLLAQRKYAQDVQFLRQKYKEQSNHLDQLLAQLTKANRKKADTGEYLTLLLRPTLDVLQKARSNIENHLKETNNTPPGSAQSYHRHHRPNRQD